MSVFCILGGLLLCASNLAPGMTRDLNFAMAPWYPNYIVAFSVITIACGFGLWRMQVWAFILYGAIFSLNQIVMVFAGDWRPSNLIVVGIFLYLLFRHCPRTLKEGNEK